MSNSKNYIKAGNPTTPVSELRMLLRDNSARVRQRLACNPNTPLDVLAELSRDEDLEVRIHVARNPQIPVELLKQLATDENIYVRFGVAACAEAQRETLEQLARDDNPYVAHQAIRTLEGIALEEALKEIGWEYVHGETQRLGELLVLAKLLSEEQVREFLRHSVESSTPLGRTLVQSRAIPRNTVVIALDLQLLIRRDAMEPEVAISVLQKKGRL